MNELANTLRWAGVVGAGGAGFPTYVKVSGKAECLIANGAECEPMIGKDQVIMTNHSALLVEGMRLVMAATGANKGIIGVKHKNTATVQALQKFIAANSPVAVQPLPDIYPAGDEVVLIYEVLRKVVAPGALPGTVGALVNNVETLLNIALAVQGIPVVDKYVTVSGWVKRPATFKLPVGTPISRAVELAGGATTAPYAILLNGFMMGTLLSDEEWPVTKTTSAIFVLPVDHPVVRHRQKTMAHILKVARSACTSCAHCSETCPRRLLGHPVRPHLVMRAASYYFPGDLTVPPAVETLPDTVEEARYCVECGLCEIVCPMGLSPRTINGYVKKLLPKKPGPANYVPTPLSTRPGLLMPTSRVYQKLGISEFAACQPAVDEKAPPVNKVRLFLKQGIGMPAVPVVKAGQEVKKGELLAEPPNDQLGVALHSSINGRISQITTEEIVVEESRGTA